MNAAWQETFDEEGGFALFNTSFSKIKLCENNNLPALSFMQCIHIKVGIYCSMMYITDFFFGYQF